MNPEQQTAPEWIDPHASTKRPPEPASGKRRITAPTLVSPELLAANPDELPTTPRIAEIPNEDVISLVEPEESGVQQQAEQKRLSRDLRNASDVAEHIKNQLASHETLSRDVLLDAAKDLNQHKKHLATLLQNAFRGSTVEDATQRREIQDTLLYLKEIQEQLQERINERPASFVEQNAYLSEGETDQLERIKTWANTAHASENSKRHRIDRLQGRLHELEQQTPDTKREAADHQEAIDAFHALVEQLAPTEPAPANKHRAEHARAALDAEIDLLRQQVIEKYGKPPEEIEREDIEREGILAHTRNAMAALTGNLDYVRQNEDPFQKWEKRIQQKATQAHQERATEPAQRKRKNAA